MILQIYSIIHTLIGLIAIFAALVVVLGLVRALPERASEREQSEGSGGRRRPLHGGEINARHL